MAGRSGALEREKLSVKDGVTHPERREEGSGSGSDLCKDPEVGRAQEGGKKTPVAGVLRAVRTVGLAKLAAPVCCQELRPLVLSWSRELPCVWRALHTSAVCAKNRAARVRVGKGDKPVTYEEAHVPHHIAHRKGWLSLHTGNLAGEDHAAERTVEDIFFRKFMLGTFPGCLADKLVLKRRANQVEICALVLRQLPAHKFYVLVGYSETLLSHFYKCPVHLHLQTVPSKVVYKYI
ncbi:28S ribosomal protein S24, mitochondrial [Balaenoptera acutorostrata]|uniref:28S ribosomal protein S24, mitochondrial n=1 Tax=Balaenoptera acutorostrata TaxID=9767 RepID=A0ABM3SCQ9_BALAC|nr:28S ribosomal protein S24, mitochondrial [Balaenoptera acutorostrata]